MSVHESSSESETEAIASALAATFEAGDVVLLAGTLGAGKTAFVRGLARGLGLDPADVSSPTFTLIHEYRGGRLPLYHADLYRLERAAVEDIGLEEMGAVDGVLAIEWPERLAHAMPGATRVDIAITGDDSRRIEISLVESRSL
jgi:tRNA threonylcarbamoyladenosine biosynthesis protein TsaE